MIIQELEDKSEREKYAERELEKLENESKKRRIEGYFTQGNIIILEFLKYCNQRDLKYLLKQYVFYAESMGIAD